MPSLVSSSRLATSGAGVVVAGVVQLYDSLDSMLSTFHRKVEIGPTWFFMQLFIHKAGEHEKKSWGVSFSSQLFVTVRVGSMNT